MIINRHLYRMIGFTKDAYGNEVRVLVPVYTIGQNIDGKHYVVDTRKLSWKKTEDAPSGLMRIPCDCIRMIFAYLDNISKAVFVRSTKKLMWIVFDLRYLSTYDYVREDVYLNGKPKSDPFSAYFCKKTIVRIVNNGVSRITKNCTPVIELSISSGCTRPQFFKGYRHGKIPGNLRLIYCLDYVKFMVFRAKDNQFYYITNMYELDWQCSSSVQASRRYRTQIIGGLYALDELIRIVWRVCRHEDTPITKVIDNIKYSKETSYSCDYPDRLTVDIPEDTPDEIRKVYKKYKESQHPTSPSTRFRQ